MIPALAAKEAVKQARRRWPIVVAIPAFLCLSFLGFVSGSPPADPNCASKGDSDESVVFDGDLARILATIRTLESGGDYTVQSSSSTASGAYQFVNRTWDSYGGYAEAWQAPPEVQDAKAAEHITAILLRNGNDVTSVPVTWYIGHVPEGAEWDTVPSAPGNKLTPRQYLTKWMGIYNAPGGPVPNAVAGVAVESGPTCVGVIGGPSPAPEGVDQLVASEISWGGYSNGEVPDEAMRYTPNSGYLFPQASQAWDLLVAAARDEGLEFASPGAGYRAKSAGGATAGRSNHGWGLAIDVTVLVPGNTYPTTEAAFASPEYQWMVANAPRFGWINPAWAKPVELGGNGRGGHRGDQCCFLEPWHWEWTAFLTLGPAAPSTA